MQDHLHLFKGIPCRNLARAQIRARKLRSFIDPVGDFLKVGNRLDPLAKRRCGGQHIFHVNVMPKLALGHINANHLPGPKRAFFDDVHFIRRHHASLGPCNQQPVTGNRIAHRAQTITVQTRANPTPVRHRQSGGAVPRLHHGIRIGIHILPRFGHCRCCICPAFRHKNRLGHRRITPAPNHHFKHRIQRRRIRRPARDHWLDVLGHVAK